MIGLVAFPIVCSCTTDPYTGRADLGSHMTAGILLGAAAGALGGRAIGVSPVEGAAAGMIAGGAVGYDDAETERSSQASLSQGHTGLLLLFG